MPETYGSPDTHATGSFTPPPKKKPKLTVRPQLHGPGGRQLRAHDEDLTKPNTLDPQTGDVTITPHRARTLAPELPGRRAAMAVPTKVIYGALAERAAHMPPELLDRHPTLAAELLVGRTPTKDLAETAKAVYEGAQRRAEAYANIEADPVSYRLASSPVLSSYAGRASNISNAQQRTMYNNMLLRAAGLDPSSPEYETAIKAVELIYTIGTGQDVDFSTLDNDVIAAVGGTPSQSMLGSATSAIGTVLSVPIAGPSWAVSHAYDYAQDHILPDALHDPMEALQGAVGTGLHTAEVGVQYGIRNIEGAVTYVSQHTPLSPLSGRDNAGMDSFDDYYTSWSEAKEGGHSPIARALMGQVGIDVDDPRYQGAAQFLDMGGDLVTQFVAFHGLAGVKSYFTKPGYAGGYLGGEGLVESWFGRRTVSKITKDLQRPTGTVRAVLLDRYKGMNPALANELANLGERPPAAAVSRTIERYIDEVPAREIPKVQRELDAVREDMKNVSDVEGPTVPAVLRSQADIGRIGMDAPGEYVYTLTKAENHASIADIGLDPARAKRGSFGTHFTESPFSAWRYADEATSQGIGGETVIYRVSKDAIPDLVVREPRVDLSTGSHTPPEVMEVFTEQGWRPVKPATHTELEVLKTREVAAGQRLTELQNWEPLWEFPKKGAIQPLMRGLPVGGRIGRLFQAMFGEGRALDLSKVSNDLVPRNGFLHDPGAAVKPTGWASHNVEVLRKTMNEAKVPKALQREIVERMFSVERGESSFYSWGLDLERAYRHGLSRDGRRPLSPEVEEAIRIASRTTEERMSSPIEITHTLADGSTVTELRNVLEGPDRGGLPSQPTHALSRYNTPDMALLQQGASTLRYWDHKIFQEYGYLRTARVGLSTARFALLTLPRLLLRPLVLVLQPLKLATTVQRDQGIRMAMEGLNPFRRAHGMEIDPATGNPIRVPLREELKAADMPIESLGMIDNALDRMPGEMVTTKMDTRHIDLNLNRADAELVAGAKYDHVTALSHDSLTRRVALDGPEATLRYLEEHPDSALARSVERELGVSIERSGKTREQWLRDKEMEIDQATGGDPALRRAIGTRQWRVGRDVQTGASIELELVRNELVDARAYAAELEAPIPRREAHLRIEALEQKVKWLEKHNQSGRHLNLEDKAAITGQILDGWADGSYRMTNEVMVRRPLAEKARVKPLTRLEKAHEWAERRNQQIYKGFRPMAAVDRNLTRGSTFDQMRTRIYDDLVKQGHPKDVALEIAQHRAAYYAADLHYDISARSSLDRKLKDYFWFSAVWREQLHTYLYKIPQRAFWAPGLALEYGMAHTLVQGLKDMGFVRDEEVATDKDGNPVTVPYFHIGGKSYSVGGWNPVQPAGAVLAPTLSPGAESILEFTAKHAPKETLPFFEAMAEQFTWDRDLDEGPSYLPRQLMATAEYFGVHIPADTFSLDDWKEINRKKEIQARRWAMSDLAKEGILPPGKDATAAEVSHYEDLVGRGTQDYDQGLGFIHLLNATINPAPLRASGTSKAGEAYYKWAEKNLWPTEYGTDEYFDKQGAYLRAHPAAWPYTVGGHEYAPPEGKEFDMNEYLSSPSLDPNDWFERAQQRVQYWKDDAPEEGTEPEVTNDPAHVAALSPRQLAKRQAKWSVSDVTDLNDVQADTVGLPAFSGREDLLKEIGAAQKRFSNQYDYYGSDEQKARVIVERDTTMKQAAAKYGPEGQAVLRYVNASPAQRLSRSGYFTGPAAGTALAMAGDVTRFTASQGSSIAGAAETTGVLAKKAALFNRVERLRAQDPRFDREMRIAELGLGEVDNQPRGRVAAYQELFFGVPFYDRDIELAVLREMS